MTARQILEERAPLLDVRAPVEFLSGAFPHSVNLPLLGDAERASVGRAYRSRGREAAIRLGHELVSGDAKQARVDAWMEFVKDNPAALVCCARGGLRSQIASEWLAAAGHETRRVDGGFKALRNEALSVIDEAARDLDWLVLGGRTGCAKTHLLRQFRDSLDFEGAAHHRGSAFGGFASPQPSQVTFENRLAVAIVCSRRTRLLVEDEGRNLGSLAIPEVMVIRMRRAPVVVLEVARSERVGNILVDYIDEPIKAGEDPRALEARYRHALTRLRKRLGDHRWREIDTLIVAAFDGVERGAHGAWIERLLSDYYDPMYDYQLEKKQERVDFRGSRDAVVEHLTERGYPASAGSASDDEAT